MTERVLTHEQVIQLADFLIGTTTTLTGALNYLFHGLEEAELDVATCADLDEHAFNCDVCGWWCDIEEEADETGNRLICSECIDNDDGDPE